MFKRKLSGVLLAGAILALGAGYCLTGTADVSAARILQLNSENASLFLPSTYEQYLSLTSPSDIAVSERYIAIAEESTIYLFDRDEEDGAVYHTYVHQEEQISKIQFSDEGRLYFSDTRSQFYELDMTDLDDLKTVGNTYHAGVSTFYIEGETLFEVSVTEAGIKIYSAPVSTPDQMTAFGQDNSKNTPQLSFSNGKFYTIVGALVTVYSFNSEKSTYEATDNFGLQPGLSGLKSATVIDDTLYYTVNDEATITEGLYSCDLSSKNYSLAITGSDFGALSKFNGKLYAVRGNAVMEYSLADGMQKTSYEISSASDSANRLSAARDSARAGDLLVTADSGNRRLSVYDMKKESYSVLSVPYTPTLVATDGEIVAAAAESAVYVYGWNSRTASYELSFSNTVANTISGIACLYGKCYFVTHGFGYGIAAEDFDDAEDLCIRDTLSDQNAPAALTNDLYGDLFVVRSDGSVLKYNESTFADESVPQGEDLNFTLPAGFRSVRADFEGDIFCLDGANVLYENGDAVAQIGGQNFVYSDGPIDPVSFALGFEDDSVYFNFGDFIVRTDAGALGFPTLATIGAAGVYEEISKLHSPSDVGYADVQQGAIGIEVDLSSLGEDAAYFPYASYARTAESGRGVVLAETAKYELIALYHDRGYDVRLFRKEQCVSAEGVTEESAGQKHLSSPCNLYNYPCIATFSSTLPRGTAVRVLYTVSSDPDREHEPDLGYDFAYVEAVTPARASLTGYVPAAFLTDADPDGGETEEFEIVKLKKDTVFGGPNGELLLEAGTEVRLYTGEDGALTARYRDGKGRLYTQILTEEMIDRGGSDALRIALIVILSVLALVIIGAYFALLPHEKKTKKH